ncbi:hypothetical protein [Novosphingobium sp. FKTRR1]|uniref:hypothetical protein n=1 Tax=Novosphingobium sp. FKTRR1 TaxID=2879118 RepID=UPI001CF0A24B|nr:hypothetical protein [Novosphingobium sp. FKTRR1]
MPRAAPPPPCTPGDVLAALAALGLLLAAATLLCWLTAPVIPAAQATPAVHYCFRADPPPCLTSVVDQ